MPRTPARQENPEPGSAVTTTPPAGTLALDALPDDIRADLIRESVESIGSVNQLPRMKILPAGAGYFEWEDTPGETIREFEAVILGHHKRNVLWDRPFGTTEQVAEADQGPACSSPDGVHGIPRRGFRHAGLPAEAPVADGFTTVVCATCPYNQWGSGNMLIARNNPRGKAVTNQRSLYLLTDGRQFPTELVLPPTSLPPFDEYLISMVNRGFPLPAVLTKLTQEVASRGGVRWGVVKFSMVRSLTMEEFSNVQAKRQQFNTAMTTTAQQQVQAEMARAATNDAVSDAEEVDEDAPPF